MVHGAMVALAVVVTMVQVRSGRCSASCQVPQRPASTSGWLSAVRPSAAAGPHRIHNAGRSEHFTLDRLAFAKQLIRFL